MIGTEGPCGQSRSRPISGQPTLHDLVPNHGFSDGNKRSAWVVARLFLADNGYHLRFDPMWAIKTVEALAAGTLEEAQSAAWFRDRVQKA